MRNLRRETSAKERARAKEGGGDYEKFTKDRKEKAYSLSRLPGSDDL